MIHSSIHLHWQDSAHCLSPYFQSALIHLVHSYMLGFPLNGQLLSPKMTSCNFIHWRKHSKDSWTSFTRYKQIWPMPEVIKVLVQLSVHKVTNQKSIGSIQGHEYNSTLISMFSSKTYSEISDTEDNKTSSHWWVGHHESNSFSKFSTLVFCLYIAL